MNIQGEEVIVIGNRAVGKTSLLASMYMYMENEGLSNIGNMTFMAEDDSEYKLLVKKWEELYTHIKTNQFTSTLNIPYEGTAATFNPHSFVFKTKKNSQVISFVDTKGGATNELDSSLIERVNQSFAIFCVVDASVLMECDDDENSKRNSPLTIKRILQRVLDDGDNLQPKACLFILTKCEKYMNSEEDRNALAVRFNKIFNPVLSYAKTKSFPLYYLPVQTMGCVEFSHIDPINNEMIFKVLPQKSFAPKDVVFPLVFLMLWLLHTMDKQQKETNIFIKWLAWFFKWKEDFAEYNQQLIKNKNIGKPTDFRSNLNGSIKYVTECNFWQMNEANK